MSPSVVLSMIHVLEKLFYILFSSKPSCYSNRSKAAAVKVGNKRCDYGKKVILWLIQICGPNANYDKRNHLVSSD